MAEIRVRSPGPLGRVGPCVFGPRLTRMGLSCVLAISIAATLAEGSDPKTETIQYSVAVPRRLVAEFESRIRGLGDDVALRQIENPQFGSVKERWGRLLRFVSSLSGDGIRVDRVVAFGGRLSMDIVANSDTVLSARIQTSCGSSGELLPSDVVGRSPLNRHLNESRIRIEVWAPTPRAKPIPGGEDRRIETILRRICLVAEVPLDSVSIDGWRDDESCWSKGQLRRLVDVRDCSCRQFLMMLHNFSVCPTHPHGWVEGGVWQYRAASGGTQVGSGTLEIRRGS